MIKHEHHVTMADIHNLLAGEGGVDAYAAGDRAAKQNRIVIRGKRGEIPYETVLLVG